MNDKQNIYDNEIFFSEYKTLREKNDNYNVLLEQPLFRKLLPEIADKSILDIGCGMGDECTFYEKMRAKKVIGIDISEKMLAEARKRTKSKVIKYYNLDMCSIGKINEKFDIVTSSLAVHYVKDFDSLLKSVYDILNRDGYFIFSQEHPLTTAPLKGCEYTFDEKGQVMHYNLADYMRIGKREVSWFVDDVVVYHRPISEIINLLIKNKFTIAEMIESTPDVAALDQNSDLNKEFHKPSFLFIKAVKK